MGTLWIRPGWLDWYEDGFGRKELDLEAARRPYGHWNHAEWLVSQEDSNEFVRTSALTALHRAMTHRAEYLNRTYNLDVIPALKGSKTLDRLERLEITRPRFLLSLRELRNVVEHDDSDVPDLARCHEFVDLIWLFLKSTDLIAMQKISDITLRDTWEGGDQAPHQIVQITWETETWKCPVWAKLFAETYSEEPIEGGLHIELSEAPTQLENELISIHGTIANPWIEMLPLWQLFFSPI